LDSKNIRKEIIDSILRFQKNIGRYYDIKIYGEQIPGDLEEIKIEIIKELHSESKYPSFKRWIIKDSRELNEEFGKYIPTVEREAQYA